MNRPNYIHSLPSTHAECGTLAVPAEDVLPEHALLRLLHEWHVRGDEVEPDIEFALQLSTAIAATQALEPSSNHEPTPEDASNMTDELDTSPVEAPEDQVEAPMADADFAEDLPDIEVTDAPEAEQANNGHNLGVEELAELLADTAMQEKNAAVPSETFGEAVTFSDGEEQQDEAPPTEQAASDHAAVAEAEAEAETAVAEAEAASTEAEAVEEPQAETEPGGESVAAIESEPATETIAETDIEQEPAPPAEEGAEEEAAADVPVEDLKQPVDPEPDPPALDTVIEQLGAEAAIEQPAAETSFDESAEMPAAETPAESDAPQPTIANEQSEEFALTNGQLDRVQDFLGELKGALIEMAQRPQTPQPAPQPESDIKPLVEALQAGFDRSAEQASQTTVALASLTEHVTQLGNHVEGGVTKTLDKAFERATAQPALAMPAAPTFVDPQSSRQTIVLGAVALVILGWSILFWIKTGSPKLALGTLIGANAVACCILLSRRGS